MSADTSRLLESIDSSVIDEHAGVKLVKRIRDHQARQKVEKRDAQATHKVATDGDFGSQNTAQYKKQMAQALIKRPSHFKWHKDEEEYHLEPKYKVMGIQRYREETQQSTKILNFLGYKIDLANRIEDFKEKYRMWLVESRHTNVLLASYAKVKFGMMQYLLTLLGVSSEEVQALQDQAIGDALDENQMLYEQNEYNLELLTIFSDSKKEKRKLKMFLKIRKDLLASREKLNPKAAISPQDQLVIKDDIVKKILFELLQEEQRLKFMRDFL